MDLDSERARRSIAGGSRCSLVAQSRATRVSGRPHVATLAFARGSRSPPPARLPVRFKKNPMPHISQPLPLSVGADEPPHQTKVAATSNTRPDPWLRCPAGATAFRPPFPAIIVSARRSGTHGLRCSPSLGCQSLGQLRLAAPDHHAIARLPDPLRCGTQRSSDQSGSRAPYADASASRQPGNRMLVWVWIGSRESAASQRAEDCPQC